MVDEKGVLITTLAVIVGVAFAGFVGYKILKKKNVLPKLKESCAKTIEEAKQSFREGFNGVENPAMAN